MALHLGAGVCQDYAHILLSLLRALGDRRPLRLGPPARRRRAACLGRGAAGRRSGTSGAAATRPTTASGGGPELHHRRRRARLRRRDTDLRRFTGARHRHLHWSKHASTVADALPSPTWPHDLRQPGAPRPSPTSPAASGTRCSTRRPGARATTRRWSATCHAEPRRGRARASAPPTCRSRRAGSPSR